MSPSTSTSPPRPAGVPHARHDTYEPRESTPPPGRFGRRKAPRHSADAAAAAQPRRPLPRRLVYALFSGVAAIWLLLDQATKLIAEETLAGRGVVDAGLVDWHLVYNPNAAFSIPGFTGMFVIVSLLVLVLLVRALPRSDRLSLVFAYGLVAGGALGNLVDRVLRPPGFPDGAVVDFIKVGWWPTFNLADSAIVVGALMIVVLMFSVSREEKAAARARSERPSIRPQTVGNEG